MKMTKEELRNKKESLSKEDRETILRQTDQINELHDRVADFLEDTLEKLPDLGATHVTMVLFHLIQDAFSHLACPHCRQNVTQLASECFTDLCNADRPAGASALN
jgi:hypothetical protein